MTKKDIVKIVVLDCSSGSVFITELEYNPSNDLECDVSDKLRELGRNLDECSWMEVPRGFTSDDVFNL